MAGELKLTPVSAAIPLETNIDSRKQPETQEKPSRKWEELSGPDVSEERREALAKAVAVAKSQPQGKLIIERDQETGKYVQKVIDPNSGQVLKQWPEEEFLELARQMGEAYGLIVDRLV